MNTCKVALCQCKPAGWDIDVNVNYALEQVKIAASNGARLICLPEMFYIPYELNKLKDIAGTNEWILEKFSSLAKTEDVYICTGSMATKTGSAITNSAYLVDNSGKVILSYAKTHLFDVNLKDLTISESTVFAPGNRCEVVSTEIGNIGIVICYDIRFPELTRTLTLKGAEIIIVPAVFNTISGPAHWHLLMRTRAVENEVYLLAISQARNEMLSYKAYGHSLVVSPWGDICVEASEGEEIIYATLNPEILTETRQRLPVLKQRRPDIYYSE